MYSLKYGNAYFKIADPLKGTAMWIAIHDATVANGTLHVIPDAFRELFPHERDPYSDHHIRCHSPAERAVAIELEAGGVAFFAYGTPTAPAPTTPTTRAPASLSISSTATSPPRQR